MAKSCYVHIPFCGSICYYCGFCKSVSSNAVKEKWIDQIHKEIQSKPICSLDTLYFGGGTPNILSKEMFRALSLPLMEFLSSDYEWTVECNPEFITENQLQEFQQLGVNRLSIGVQTFQDSLLQKIGRHHSSKQAMDSINLSREFGFHNLSVDLMYGLPGQSLDDVIRDLETFFSLGIDHLSIYSLQIEENSIFGKKGIRSCDDELEADMFEQIVKMCKKHGFEHYEISSFARNQQYSKHNLCYWTDQDYYGIGCGAAGRENGILYENTKDLLSYCDRGPMPSFISETIQERAFDSIMMALRTQFGLDVTAWQKRYGLDFFMQYKNVLKKYLGTYLCLEKNHLFPTEQGMEILNTILVDFLSEN